MRIQIDEGSVTLTPFGSLIRTNRTGVKDSSTSLIAKLRALLASLFR
jgi:hypothetical protein